MEKDTVILSLNDYNNLYNFKQNIINNKVCELSNYISGYVYNSNTAYPNYNSVYFCKFYTESEIIKKFELENKKLLNEIENLQNSIRDLKYPKTKKSEVSLENIKNMNVLQFIMWKKSLKN